MITLKKGNIVMEVATEVQASVFLRSGYEEVAEINAGEAPTKAVAETEANEAPAEEPKKRRRTAKKSAEE